MSKEFYGIYPGTCVDISDPQKRYRIKVRVPQVLGGSTTNWAEACMPITSFVKHEETLETEIAGDPPHFHEVILDKDTNRLVHMSYTPEKKSIPELGQVVWVMFIGGNPNYPVWIGVGA
jgi:hypothetical protein